MSARFSGVVVIGMMVTAACFSPSFDRPTCGPNGECPSGMICDAQSACESLPDTCHAFALSCPAGQTCAANQAVCIDIGGCGDGIVEPGEVCDDGNIVDGGPDPNNPAMLILDPCSHDCQSTQVCGNKVVDKGEQCDEGSDNGSPTSSCDSRCHFVSRVCGNGMVDPDTGEECDPGTMDSAGCNSNMAGAVSCKAARCGDGYTNMAAGEKCDSSGPDTMLCNGKLCTLPVCGDSYVNMAAGEQCESGGQNTPTCNGSAAAAVACHLPSCGDGYVNTSFTPSGGSAPEQCDTLGGGDTQTCNGSSAGAVKCRLSACGDGYLNRSAGEECEVGAGCAGGKTCSSSCKCI